MRLLRFDSDKLTLTNFAGREIPPYAILSHRWTAEEVLFNHVYDGKIDKMSAGWRKIKFCAERAAMDGLQYFWCDTCCIDKWNKAELAKAVNSMFKYYREASKCYVYLQPTQALETTIIDEEEFRHNDWFKRGWTLQELVAPLSVEFFDPRGQRIGDRASFRQAIHEITGIPLGALDGNIELFSQEDRMKWAENRVTTEPEDAAYCLLGILGVQMPLTYGEGKHKALVRLRRELEVDGNAACLIPFSRKDYTIGCEASLSEIESRLFGQRKEQFLTIIGESGLGKSHLALEFAYTIRESRAECSVLWCDASSQNSLNQAYHDIAQKLHLVSDQAEADHIANALRLYLNSEATGEWLLIYDNLDDISLVSGIIDLHQARTPTQSLLSSTKGTVLVTTRSQQVASQVPGEFMEMCRLSNDSSASMLQAFLASSGHGEDRTKDLAQLAKTSSHPLAIVLMTAYIRTQEITMNKYISELETFSAMGIHSCSPAASPSNTPIDQSLKDIIGLSLQRISSNSPGAAKCIFEMACLNQTDIPLAFVHAAHGGDAPALLSILEHHALITRRPASSAIDIHDLVHTVVRQRLEATDLWRPCLDRAQKALLEVFPDVNERSRSHWRRLLPHARYILANATAEESAELAELRYRCEMVLLRDGRYPEAEELQAQTLEKKKHHDPGRNVTLSEMTNLAATMLKQGRLKEAEVLQTQVLDSRRNKPEKGDLHARLTSLTNLAATYFEQGRYKEAEELQLEGIAQGKNALGVDHPSTLGMMANLAANYNGQGRLVEAEELGSQVLTTRTKVLGHDHPDTLTSMSNLAWTFRSQGKVDEAQLLLRQVLETEKLVLGPEHPSTVVSLSNLAGTLIGQGRWEEAEKLFRQALGISTQVLGPNNYETLAIVDGLELSLRGQNRLEEAEKLRVDLLETMKRVLGHKHPSTLTASGHLAIIYMSQEKWPQAEELHLELLRLGQDALGSSHPQIVTTRINLGFTVGKQGRWSEARELQEKGLEDFRALMGPQHPQTLSSMANLAFSCAHLGEWDEAEALYLQVLELRSVVLGQDHPHTLDTKQVLVDIYKSQGRDKDVASL